VTRRICAITGTRAEYGVITPLLRKIRSTKGLRLQLVVTSMHLSKEFGMTRKVIQKDGFKIDAKVDILPEEDTNFAQAKSIGDCITGMAKAFDKLRPDIIVVTGDRGEMLASAIAAAYMNIPVAHIHGGDSSGNIDNLNRDAITKFSHIHFPAMKENARKIIGLGEEPWRVHVVGAIAMDTILGTGLMPTKEVARKFGLDLKRPVLLVIQHPVTYESDRIGHQTRSTMDAVVELGYQTVLVYPNSDAGGRKMIQVINRYRKYPLIKMYKNIPRVEFLSLMRVADVLIGNSSAGIIEAPSFQLPVINIGTRQVNRVRCGNVIDIDHDKDAIIKAVRYAMCNKGFRTKLRRIKNAYGDGRSSARIVEVLKKIKLDEHLLVKR
jgi:UDP-N-acetylglucosamine 2-epimerase (non-hydrolysing)/GDP/UDP-N,N'-diacetylbacillosamine 2-epimerase (hydrolysing)